MNTLGDQRQPPVQRLRYATADLDEGSEVLEAQHPGHGPSISADRSDGDRGGGERGALRLTSDTIASSAGWLRIERVRHGLHTRAPHEPRPEAVVMVPLAGRGRSSCGRRDAFGIRLAPMWAPFESEWEAPDVLLGVADLAAVQRLGAEIADIDPAAVTFTEMTPISPALGRSLAALLGRLRRDLAADDDVMASPLVRGQALRRLAAGLLATFPNTTHTAMPAAGSDSGSPATVRHAIEFIDAHAHEDVGPGEIADAARVCPRGLRAAFARGRDTGPLEHLRRVRLERAHRDLQTGDPTRGDTVAGIARRWGFAYPDQFAVPYQRVYGRSPAEVLGGGA